MHLQYSMIRHYSRQESEAQQLHHKPHRKHKQYAHNEPQHVETHFLRGREINYEWSWYQIICMRSVEMATKHYPQSCPYNSQRISSVDRPLFIGWVEEGEKYSDQNGYRYEVFIVEQERVEHFQKRYNCYNTHQSNERPAYYILHQKKNKQTSKQTTAIHLQLLMLQ